MVQAFTFIQFSNQALWVRDQTQQCRCQSSVQRLDFMEQRLDSAVITPNCLEIKFKGLEIRRNGLKIKLYDWEIRFVHFGEEITNLIRIMENINT